MELVVPLVPPGYVDRSSGLVQANVDDAGHNIVGDAANEPSIAIDPRAPNRMVIAWRQFDSIRSDFRQAGYSYSRDGGRTWKQRRLAAGQFRTDPVLRASADGVIYWNTQDTNFDTFVHASTDGGRTWGIGVPSHGSDKTWMVVDRTNGPGRGFIHLWTSYNFSYMRSTNAGASFSTPIPANARWGTMAIGPGGELYFADSAYCVLSQDANNSAVTPTFQYRQTSLGGGGFSPSDGPNPAGLVGQANVVVDTSNSARRGYVYVVSTVTGTGTVDRAEVFFSRSIDRGITWSPRQRINTDPPNANAWQWFATMSIAPNGRLDVVWNDTRESLNTRLCRTYYRSSSDGGFTWSAERVLTPTWDSWVGWPQNNKIGDYYDMESDDVGASLAFATTLNGEQDVYFLRIGDYDCNQNGVGDAAEIAARPDLDCNTNGILDSCEIAAGTFADRDRDGILDICQCPADVDDGSGMGRRDGGVTVEDLAYYLDRYFTGTLEADMDDGSGAGQLDDGVTIDDLLFFLSHYAAGC